MALPDRRFVLDVLIKGSSPALAAASRLTGIKPPPQTPEFSLERIVPRPADQEATEQARCELLERFQREVREPWRKLAREVGLNRVEVDGWSYSMNFELDWLAESLWSLHPDAGGSASDWMTEHRGRRDDVACSYSVDERLEWLEGNLFARFDFSGADTEPPLPVFDKIAKALPTVEIVVAWSSEDMWLDPEGTGVALWRHGMRFIECSSKRVDTSDPEGRLRSRRPIQVAEKIYAFGIEGSRCRPTVRWDLTVDELNRLEEGQALEIEFDAIRSATVGSSSQADFCIDGYRVTGSHLYDNSGWIAMDEAWRRIPGTIGDASVALTLHSTEVVARNEALLHEVLGDRNYENERLSRATYGI